MSSSFVRFGAFEFDTQQGELTRSGRRVHLPPQSATLLGLLVSRAGQIVTRGEINHTLWGDDTFVDFDAAVNACISQIRFALGDKPTAPRFVETIPRKGYRFVAPVIVPSAPAAESAPVSWAPSAAADNGPAAMARSAAGPAERSRARAVLVIAAGLVLAGTVLGLAWLAARAHDAARVAVLPISAEGSDTGLEALGNLLQERTLVELHRTAGDEVAVVAKPAVEHARGLNRTIDAVRGAGVGFFIDATLRRVEGGKVRLHAKVVRTSDQRILWATDYEFPESLFVEQRATLAQEMALRLITASGGAHAADESRTEAVAMMILSAAHDLRNGSPSAPARAIQKLVQACAREPQNDRARALLALARVHAAIQLRRTDNGLLEDARADALLALRQQPENPHAIAALGAAQLFLQDDWESAGRLLSRAAAHRQAWPETRAWFAIYLSATGRHADAIAQARRLEQMQPIADTSAPLARALYLAGRHGEARHAAERVVAIHPEGRGGLTWLWLASLADRHPGELGILERLTRSVTRQELSDLPREPPARRRALLRHYRAGLEAEYHRGGVGASFQIAVVAAAMADVQAARAWLDRAVEVHAPLAVLAAVHPLMSGISADIPRRSKPMT